MARWLLAVPRCLMGLRFSKPLPALPAEHAKLVNALREMMKGSRFGSQDELGRAMYGTPPNSRRRHGRRISEIANGVEFPTIDQIEKIVTVCDQSREAHIVQLFKKAEQERADNDRPVESDIHDRINGIDPGRQWPDEGSHDCTAGSRLPDVRLRIWGNVPGSPKTFTGRKGVLTRLRETARGSDQT